MQQFYSALFAGLTGLCLGGCSAPISPTPAYPQNHAISDAQGRPRDSTTFYFPAATWLDAEYALKDRSSKLSVDNQPFDEHRETCRLSMKAASENLYCFGAPVLSNYYLGTDTYRFLWLRSFQRPVLLTLQHRPDGSILRTQLLTKWAILPKTKLSEIIFALPNSTPTQLEKLRAEHKAQQQDPEIQHQLAEKNQPAVQEIAQETTVAVTLEQEQHFHTLLQDSHFQLLPACQSSPDMLDGAYWVLESHQANGYHMVFRHSPDKRDGFRKACEYLIELSSARNEERY